jgi:putative ABC transport system substrate-binding protein
MISRRSFLAGAGALLLSRQASAQPAKVWRIGWLAPEIPEAARYLQGFKEELRAFGYIEGQNIVIEYRSSAGRTEALPALAEELVQLKVDVIVAPTTPVARAAKAATSSIPVVFTIVSDPIGSGLVASFSRPGGNVTGMSDMGVDLVARQLDLLKELVPRLKRVGAVGHPADKVWDGVWSKAPAAARQLQIEVVPVLIRTPNDFETAFAGLNSRVQALLISPQAFFSAHRRRLIELELSSRLPAIHEFRGFPDEGALMSYGPDYPAIVRKAVRHVDKILRGARPADLPVEQPTEYEFVINLKTAKALGLTIPQVLLERANAVIR